MGKFEFKSAICTSVEQSKRLLELGLKKETADITLHYERATEDYKLQDIPFSRIMYLRERLNKRTILGVSGDDLYAKDIPAWSLHRLMEILSYTPELSDFATELQYDAMIIHIANAIEANNINKDYLEEKK